MALGRENRVVEHKIYSIEDYYGKLNGTKIDNIVFKTQNPEEIWLADTSNYIADFRSEIQSSYIRWSLAINGLYVAHEKYKDENWQTNNIFKIHAIRPVSKDLEGLVPIAEWKGEEVATNHIKTTVMMASWGIVDLYGLVEKFILNLFDFYYMQNPSNLLQGPEFRELRQMYRKRDESEESLKQWNNTFKERLSNWKRKKLYDGIDKVFINYCNLTGIYTENNDIFEQHAICLKGLSVLRNSLIHGLENATEELEDATQHPFMQGIHFKKDSPLIVTTEQLQSVERYLNVLLTNLNKRLLFSQAWEE